MKPIFSVYPKVQVSNGRGWCRACCTMAVVVDGAEAAFRRQHERCREQRE